MDSGCAGGIFSRAHFRPPFVAHFGVPGIIFTGERGNVPARGCDELGKQESARSGE